jgi:alcohol dehydrogenase class IV
MTEDFIFNTVPQISSGPGKSNHIGEMAVSLGITHAFVVTDPGIIQFGLLKTALTSLAKSNIVVTIYSDVVADPPEDVIISAVAKARSSGCDGIIGFGGGSSMDTAKLVAILLGSKQELAEMYGIELIRGARKPLIQVPTTAGTGSEVTPIAIVTTGETTKAGISSRILLADRVILDPELTLGLPPAVTAATGIDAMVHAIEAYTSLYLKNPVSDMFAREALTLMARHLPTAVAEGGNIAARSGMLLGAMLAGQAFANAPVGAVHALAYPLGGTYHIPHGLSNSLVLPHVLRFNAPAAGELYRELAPIILQCNDLPDDNNAVCERLADHFLQLAADLGLPTRLRDMNITEEALARLAEQALLQQRILANNPRAVSLEDALDIYRQAW